VTASAIKGDIEQCLDAGMNDFVPKPTTLAELGNKVDLWSQSSTTSSNQVLDPNLASVAEKFPEELQNLAQTVREMRSRYEAGSKSELEVLAQIVKLNAAKFGMLRLKSLAQKVETAAKNGELESVSLAIRQIPIELSLALLHLKRSGLASNALLKVSA
jgi:two-component system, sensor histidine kinase